MDAASFQFVCFGLIVAYVSNFSRSVVWRSLVLMCASAIVFALLTRSLFLLLPMAVFLLFGFVGIELLERGWAKSSVWSIVLVVFAYAWLKKYTFLPPKIFLDFPYFTLGLSYIFFRILQLLIEAGELRSKRHIGLARYLLYNLNFLTLVSGPIQSYEAFARDQFALEPIHLDARMIGRQFERIIRGFFKVNVVALLLHAVQQDALVELHQPVAISMKLFAASRVAVAYPFFLYANFSGYIDIVIALSRLMRVRLPENFDHPFSAASFLEFWSRWHITLSTWLKTYIYNPLLMALMSRISSTKIHPYLGVLAFFVTFFLVGVWHGRTSEFMFFGLLQGGGVSVNKLWQLASVEVLGRKRYKALSGSAIYVAFARGLTFSWFAFTLFWFWGSWTEIFVAFASLGIVGWLGVWVAIWMVSSAGMTIWQWTRSYFLSIRGVPASLLYGDYARVMFATILAVTSFVITGLLDQPAPEIIYKAF